MSLLSLSLDSSTACSSLFCSMEHLIIKILTHKYSADFFPSNSAFRLVMGKSKSVGLLM